MDWCPPPPFDLEKGASFTLRARDLRFGAAFRCMGRICTKSTPLRSTAAEKHADLSLKRNWNEEQFLFQWKPELFFATMQMIFYVHPNVKKHIFLRVRPLDRCFFKLRIPKSSNFSALQPHWAQGQRYLKVYLIFWTIAWADMAD